MFYQLVVICFVCLLWSLWRRKQSKLEPPELSGKLPIVGHAHWLMGDAARLYKSVQQISRECLQKGGVIKLSLGLRKVYCIADPEDCLTIANTCLQKHHYFNFAKPFLGNGLITADAQTWKRNRKLLNPAFNQQVLDGFIVIFNTQAQNVVERFSHELGKPLDHESLLRRNNLETICLTAFGADVSQYADLHANYLPCFSNILKTINERTQKLWLQNDFIYNLTPQKKMLEEDLKNILALSHTIIQKKKSEKKNQSNAENKTGKLKAFVDLILDLADDTGCFTDEQIREETDNIIAGGHDTTATLLTYALTLLGSHSEVQRKAYEEVTNVIGNSKEMIERDDLSKLVFIEAILKETLRFYPLAPILPRCIDKNVKLKNYTIEANAECFLLIFGLLRHDIWGPDADQFRPERWLEKETLPDPKYFGGFGLGRRACIGKSYGMMSMKIILAHVIRKYRVSSDVSKMVVQMHVMSRPGSGHHITLALRNTSASDQA